MEQIAGSPRKAAPRPQAEAVTLLLRDWEKYGISERVCYHFDLIEVLTSDEAREDAATTVTPSQPRQPEEQKQQQEVAPVRDDSSQTNPSVCGVVRLLECIPLGRLEKRHRRMLRTRINRFNEMADTVHKMGPISCYAPRRFPLRLDHSTRLSFAYEMTRIAFCLDASPTLVSTYGDNPNLGYCCPLDRLPGMVETFLRLW